MKNHLLQAPIAILGILVFTAYLGAEEFPGMRYLDNGVIKIGMNLNLGGAITYLSKSDSNENIINSHDWGRQIQMSFYSGPVPFEPNGKKPYPEWWQLGWNPIQSGDVAENRSRVLESTQSESTLYVKSVPMQWPLDNEPGECTFETWIALEGKTAKVRSKIINHRKDITQYRARTQELPAVYSNGTYYRLFTYRGDSPFTGGELHQVTKVWDPALGINVEGGPWDSWYATENWAALVNEENQGIGVWSPGTYSFSGGFAGVPGKGGPKDSPTGYISPNRREILDHNIEYAYDYVLIVGSLDEIRSHVVAHAHKEHLPSYTFANDRQSWTLRDCIDSGWPLPDGWHIRLTGKQPLLVGPNAFWDAFHMPRLYLRAAFNTGKNQAVIRFERFGKEKKDRYGDIAFDIVSDGKMREYWIDISSLESYRGPCTRITLKPLTDGAKNRVLVVKEIKGVKGL